MPHDQATLAIERPDGHRFELIHVVAESPRRSLFFVPGMGLSARLFIPFAQSLAGIGVETFIHEWRGNGSSNWRAARDRDWGYAELLGDLAAARDALRVERHLLGGHSLGAQLACLSAAAQPDRLAGLILIAGGLPHWRAFPWPMNATMMATMFAFPALGAMFGYYPGKRVGFGGNEARSMIADWARSARTGRYRPRGVATDLEAGLRNLQLAVLAVPMADDHLVPERSLDALLAKLSGCRISKRLISAASGAPEADHYRWMKDPRATAAAVEAWLQKP